MKESSKEIYLEYKSIDLFNIVLDIEKYPEYIPWCSKIEILNKNKNEIKAVMLVDYKLLKSQKFTSEVYFDITKLIIKTKYVDGPLKNLDTLWKFKKIKEKKTKILFQVKFEFKNFIHQKISNIFFPLIENKMIESFKDRADKILN